MFHFESRPDLEGLTFSLMGADLDLALTCVQIALQTVDREKAIRNRLNARKAYDAGLRFMGGTNLSRGKRENLTQKLNYLKTALVKLGESF
jgi:hypothetical protein